MRPRIVLVGWLVVAWVALWRDVSIANTVSGVLVGSIVVWWFPPAAEGGLHIRPLALLRFIGSSAISILRANLVVAWEVLTPSNRINEGVVAVELASNNPVVITHVTHAIILAPGTMVIDIDKGSDDRPTVLFIHVLHLRSVEEVREDVLQLETLALAAVSGRADAEPPTTTDEGEAR
ncbi:MAG: Na+/H+ antiporter subunit E [Acidimicrobiales bacterium]